jgi:hypothetical protein
VTPACPNVVGATTPSRRLASLRCHDVGGLTIDGLEVPVVDGYADVHLGSWTATVRTDAPYDGPGEGDARVIFRYARPLAGRARVVETETRSTPDAIEHILTVTTKPEGRLD